MRLIRCLTIIVCVVFAGSASGQDSKKLDRPVVFTVDGLFSVETPPKGFKWAEVRKLEAAGVKARICACIKEGSTARIVLTVEESPAKDEQARVATLKAHYNSLVESLKSAGFTDLKSTKPNFEPPIKDRSGFTVSGKNAEGASAFIHSVTVFNKNVYLFQIFADSKDEADQLAKISETLKEPKQEKRP